MGDPADRPPVRQLDAALTDRLLDGVDQGLAVVREGRIVWCNRALSELAGRREARELVGLALTELLDGEPSILCKPAPFEAGLLGPDGTARPTRWRPLEPGGDDGQAWVIQAGGELRTLPRGGDAARLGQARLGDARQELEVLRDRLRRETTAREELLTVVSHELRTPVTVISGYNRLLLTGQVGSLSPEQKRFLEESERSCKRIDAFIGNLLESAREASGGDRVQLLDGSLEATVRGVVRFLTPLLEEHGLRLELALDPAAEFARFDPMRLEQVLTNLVGNAIKYARAGGRVGLATRRVQEAEGAFVEISVSDDGPGVDPADRERIFEPYVRSGKRPGLGLGLAICRRLVEAHGGTIQVGDRPEGGSCFTVRLPLPDSMAGRPS